MQIRRITMEDIPRNTLLVNNLFPGDPQVWCEWRHTRLHPDLQRLKWTKRHISKELCTGTCRQEHGCLIGLWEEAVAVQVLEDLVETVFPTTLEAVSNQCR